MQKNNVVLEVKPEEVLADTVTETAEEVVEATKGSKFNAKKGLAVAGLALAGLLLGYGAYKGTKWLINKGKAKKAAKAEAETETEETTEN